MEQLKINQALAISLAAIPVTNFFGLHFYLNDAIYRGFASPIIYACAIFTTLFGYTGDEESDPTPLLATGISIMTLWYLYSLFYSIWEVGWYNERIENLQKDIRNIEMNFEKQEDSPEISFGLLPLTDGVMFNFGIRF